MNEILELEAQAERLRAAGKIAEEVAVWDQILAIDESFVRAHLALSVACYKLKDFARSVSHAERACQLEPGDSFNFTALSVTYQRAYAGTGDTTYIRKAEDARDLARQVKEMKH